MSSETEGKGLKYEEIVELKEKKEITLIDVRNESEIEETGKLPGSIHIPLGEVKYSLERLTPAEFLAKHGVTKPPLDTPLVFSCRTGGRARSALDNALSLGYKNAKYYDGGFLDWQKRTTKA